MMEIPDFYLPSGRTALLISGGVDSAVALHLLYQRGVRPDLYYIKIGMEGEDSSCTYEEDIELSQAIAARYGLKLQVIDLQQEYWDLVVGYIVDRVRRGLTPNSDVMCNKLVKFGAFEQRVGKDYDYLCTGHYAQLKVDRDGQLWLCAGVDLVKDQTDFLSQLSSSQIRKCIFPLGGMMKRQVREIAEAEHLPCAHRKDSQGICFLGKINYAQFISRFLGERTGDIVDIETGRVLGQHKGYWFHTIGQRKGLRLGGGPWFVVRKDIERNIVYVAHGYDTRLQYGNSFALADFHILTQDPLDPLVPNLIRFKVRHTERPVAGTMSLDASGHWHIESTEPIQGIAPGQFGVIYDAQGDRCIGSGEIASE